ELLSAPIWASELGQKCPCSESPHVFDDACQLVTVVTAFYIPPPLSKNRHSRHELSRLKMKFKFSAIM
ncbi:MAG: hypothetical protein MJ100_11290, partial [Ruminococcus sp.]|nr:hypothetical protein [Ruminococcus sp.]